VATDAELIKDLDDLLFLVVTGEYDLSDPATRDRFARSWLAEHEVLDDRSAEVIACDAYVAGMVTKVLYDDSSLFQFEECDGREASAIFWLRRPVYRPRFTITVRTLDPEPEF